MLFTLILKDVRIMYRSILYSLFEILVAMLLFLGIGYLLYEFIGANDGGYPDTNQFNEIQWNNSISSRYPPKIYVEEPMEYTIRNLTKGIKSELSNMWSNKEFVDHDEINSRYYVGIVDKGETEEYEITPALEASQYKTNSWGRDVMGETIDKEMFNGIVHFMTEKIGPIESFQNTTPRVYTLPETGRGFVSRYVPLIMQTFMVLVVVNITRHIVHEKTTFIPYLVSMGLPISTYYLALFLFNFVKCLVIFTPGFFFFAQTQKSTIAAIYLCVSIIIFLIPAITFAFMIASFFKTGKSAILVCLIVWLALVFLPYKTIGDDTEQLSNHWLVLPTCLIFTFNMHYIGETLATMTEFGQFSMFATSGRVLPLWALWLGLLINGVNMFILAVLFGKMDGRFGCWHRYFHRRNECERTAVSQTTTQTGTQTGTPPSSPTKRSKGGADKPAHRGSTAQDEELRENLESDIDIHNVVKIYSTGEMAVKGLTMRAIRGQVSVLLGHNGCGKSTTFAMIAGMSQPTEGTIEVCGMDVVANRSEARKKIGLCPQYNPLIDKLTVWEHLKIVHALKKAETPFKEDAEKLLEVIDLLEKKNELSMNLSGGMKRKLCMCMALIGDSSVVLLDEPTCGMDATARVDVQKMLRSIKKDRTILLTTHNMDEADKLADWVYVMSEGRIQASGSSQFLKSKFGGGWLITVVTGDAEKDAPTLLEVCKKFANSATIKDTRGQMIEFNVPSDDRDQLVHMLKCLEAISEKDFDEDIVRSLEYYEKVKNLDISSLGVSLNSLEQVFISVIEQCEEETKKNRTAEQKSEILHKLLDKKEEPPAYGPLSQFIGLSMKRLVYFRRNSILHILNLLLPICMLALSVYVLKNKETVAGLRKTSVDVNLIPADSIVVIQSDSDASKIESFFAKNPNLIITKFGTDRDLMDIVNKEQFFRRISVVVKVENQVATGVWVNNKMIKANTVGALLKLKLPPGLMSIDYKITFNWLVYSDIEAFYSNSHILNIILFTFLVTYSISTCALLHAEERVSKFKHQQFLTEMSPSIYWFSMYFWEFLIFVLSLVGFIGVFMLFGIIWGQTAIEMFLISCLAWFATAPIIFIFSLHVDSPSKLIIVIIFFCFIFPFVKIAVDLSYYSNYPMLHNTRFLCPFQPFITLIFWSYSNMDPKKLYSLQAVARACFTDLKADNIYVFDLLSLTGSVIFYNCLLFSFSSKYVQRIFNGYKHSKHLAEPRIPLNMEPCHAVEQEEKDVTESRLTPENCTVLVNDMVKRYGDFQAVNGVFLGVKQGECFGLLGVNGAGKSTMIEILTGKQFACSGQATINEVPVDHWVKVGYCPQFDAVLSDFTGRDVFKILARLHNYPNPSELVNELIDCIGMTGNADKQIRYCSGGQKRKISMGMGILSRSSAHSGGLIILDEPTAGVDPKARRDLWDIVVGMRSGKQHGASTGIMLTSHSMEECEALCTRIGILRKGEMIALGSHQDLKSKYGNTFTLTIVMKNENEKENEKEKEHENERKEIIEKIRQTFGEKSILLTDEDDHTNNLVWEIPREKGEKWSTKMDEVKKVAEELNIENYFLVQSSLEDTFIKMNSANIEKKQV